MSRYIHHKNPYGFVSGDGNWKTLQRILDMEDNAVDFCRIKDDLRAIGRKYFDLATCPATQVRAFTLMEAEIKKKQPLLFKYSEQSEKYLYLALYVIKTKHSLRKYALKKYYAKKKRSSDSSPVSGSTPFHTEETPPTLSLNQLDSQITTGSLSSNRIGPTQHAPGQIKTRKKRMQPVVLLTRRKQPAKPSARADLRDTARPSPTGLSPHRSVVDPENSGYFASHSPSEDGATGEAALTNDISTIIQVARRAFETPRNNTSSRTSQGAGGNTSTFLGEGDQGITKVSRRKRGTHLERIMDCDSLSQAGVTGPPSYHSDLASSFDAAQNGLHPCSTAQEYDAGFSIPAATRSTSRKSSEQLGPRDIEILPEVNLPARNAPRCAVPKKPVAQVKLPKDSSIVGIHRFLATCNPPMVQHLRRFVDFGCKTTEYLRGISTWAPGQRRKLLEKVLQSKQRGTTLVPEIDIAVLENQFETYFADDDA